MAPEIALNLVPEAGSGRPLTILDPMCGSGTVLTVAAERGHDATGVDLDPLAVLMSKVATNPLDMDKCEQTREQVVTAAKSDRKRRMPWSDNETTKFAEYWFGGPQRLQLARLARAIDGLPSGPLRELAQVSLSRTIITKTPRASLAADTSHSRPHRVTESSDYEVIKGFEQSFLSLTRLLAKRMPARHARVILDDCRRLTTIEDATIDLAITSPPYLNAIDYMRGHKLALIWLGYTIPELRSIRSTSIGAERALDGNTAAKSTELVATIVQEAANPDLLPYATLTRYSNDLLQFARQMKRVIRRTGTLVVVIGNSTLRGNFIRNETLVKGALQHYGFSIENRVERELPDNRRYLPIGGIAQASPIARRMRTESVLQFDLAE